MLPRERFQLLGLAHTRRLNARIDNGAKTETIAAVHISGR
jgi:hypothetical protein